MTLWFFLLLLALGWMTYSLLQRSIAAKGTVPLWVLWLVMMTPALTWAGWILVQGTDAPMPLVLALVPFLLCPIVYWVLLRHSLQTAAQRRQETLGEAALVAEEPDLPTPPRPLSQEEEATLNHCFPWSHFALHKVEYRLQAVICQGQLRSDPSVAYQHIQQNITRHFGDRFLVLLQENLQGQPFFALVPNPQIADSSTASESRPSTPPNQRLLRPGLAIALMGLTLCTTTLMGLGFAGLTPQEISTLLENPGLLWEGLPYGLAIMAVLGCHELGHFWATRRYKIQATLPYFIPIPLFLGTLGAFIQIRSPIPHRKALFDVSIAGPLAGLVATVPCLWWGLQHSLIVDRSDTSSLLNFESLDPWQSIILAVLSRLALGDVLRPDMALQLHPVAVAGYLGLIVTALNLMPVGQLDGGHIVHAMFGQRTGAIIGQVARLFMLLLSLTQPDLFLWALLLLFMPVVDEPALNDVSELNDGRDLLGFATLLVLLLIVLPAPHSLVTWLT